MSYLLMTFFYTISSSNYLKFVDYNVTVVYEASCKELQIFLMNESSKLSMYSDYLLVKTLRWIVYFKHINKDSVMILTAVAWEMSYLALESAVFFRYRLFSYVDFFNSPFSHYFIYYNWLGDIWSTSSTHDNISLCPYSLIPILNIYRISYV